MYNERRGHHYFGSFADVGFKELNERHGFGVGAIISIVVAVIAAGVSTYMQVRASQQAADEADAISSQKDKEAEAAVQTAAYQEQQLRRRQTLLLGKNQAIATAAGVDLSSGSPLFNEIDLTTQAELDALNVRRGGAIESNARSFESNIAKYRAQNARGAVPFEIAGGVLQASSSAAKGYLGYKYKSVASDWVNS